MGKIEQAEQDADTRHLGVKIGGNGKDGLSVEVTRHDGLREIFGGAEDEQATALLSHCLNAVGKAGGAGNTEQDRLFMLSIVRDMAPRDPVERMLAVQMAATHVASIRSARWLAGAETIPQVQAHYTGMNKLTRTFAAQVEALRKHRTGGNQTVTVQHVNVEDGGQAIVGSVHTRGRGDDET